jgi:DNA invertase Pin-like site-specific DNA recombinase
VQNFTPLKTGSDWPVMSPTRKLYISKQVADVAKTKVFRTTTGHPDYLLFRCSEVSHNLSGKLCPKYLSLDKIRDMRIGYARVSTDDQTLDLQRDALKRARCREIYEEQASGKTTGRPQLDGCIKSLREGDTLVVWRLDRLGRNLADLVRLIADLEQRKVNLESLTEKIETGSPAGRLVFHVFAALAEFERNLIRERTVAGLKAARARGRKGGRPAKLAAKEIKTIRGLLRTSDMPVAEIAARFGVARSTLYRSILKPAV